MRERGTKESAVFLFDPRISLKFPTLSLSPSLFLALSLSLFFLSSTKSLQEFGISAPKNMTVTAPDLYGSRLERKNIPPPISIPNYSQLHHLQALGVPKSAPVRPSNNDFMQVSSDQGVKVRSDQNLGQYNSFIVFLGNILHD
eukprot:sb/3474103/